MLFSGYSGFLSTNKVDRHDIDEILLNVALNTIKLNLKHYTVILVTCEIHFKWYWTFFRKSQFRLLTVTYKACFLWYVHMFNIFVINLFRFRFFSIHGDGFFLSFSATFGLRKKKWKMGKFIFIRWIPIFVVPPNHEIQCTTEYIYIARDIICKHQNDELRS